MRVVLHDDVGPTAGGGADLENTDDVRVPGELAHRHLLTHEPLDVVRLDVGCEHLDRHRAIERALGTSIHHTEAAAADLLGFLETGRHQLRRYPGVLVPLRRQRVDVGHRSPRYSTAPWRRHDRWTQHMPNLACPGDSQATEGSR